MCSFNWEEVADSLREGNHRAWNDMVHEMQPALIRFAARRLRDQDQVEDVVQEGILSVYKAVVDRKLDRLTPGYIFGAVAFSVLDARKKRRLPNQSNLGEDCQLSELAIDSSSCAADPLQQLEREEVRTLIRKAMKGRPQRERQVIWLKLAEELTAKQIAVFLGDLNVQQVFTIFRRELPKLKSILHEDFGLG